MRAKWLKFVLRLTNQIFKKKQAIINKEGFSVVSNVLSLFFFELFLAVVSFPLYLGVKPEKVVAFFKEEGSYKKVAYDYSLRRILTLTSAGIIFFLLLIKLLIILVTPNVAGPLQLYTMTDLEPADVLTSDITIAETQIQTAKVLDVMRKPKVQEIEKMRNGAYTFRGTGQPMTTLVLFLSDQQTAIYTVEVDENGDWEVEYTKKDFKLSEGNHAVVAFCYDEKSSGRSQLSDQQYFKVKTSLADKLFNNMDVFLNIIVIIIIALGIFLIVLTV